MKVRKIAKQLKQFHKNLTWDNFEDRPIIGYRIVNHEAKVAYITRMTRKHYFGLAKKHKQNSMMCKFYIHKACNPFIYDEILEFWNIDAK